MMHLICAQVSYLCILGQRSRRAFCFLHDAHALTFREMEGTDSSLAEFAGRGREAGDTEGAPSSFA